MFGVKAPSPAAANRWPPSCSASHWCYPALPAAMSAAWLPPA